MAYGPVARHQHEAGMSSSWQHSRSSSRQESRVPAPRGGPPNRGAASAPQPRFRSHTAIGKIPVQSYSDSDMVANSESFWPCRCALLRQKPLKSCIPFYTRIDSAVRRPDGRVCHTGERSYANHRSRRRGIASARWHQPASICQAVNDRRPVTAARNG